METISGYRFRFDIEQSSFKTAIKQMREQLRFLKKRHERKLQRNAVSR
ncbi:hypothetical protein S101258_00451 [Lactiplantibacillus plantarum subsp. plantarum]|uniref:Uncharacterized protein n=1 Tax=Lactiplantibacillus plantarum subsp. plantarum TaxID=337330 RepID=A0A2S3U8Z0_LACPN|nr:hypothetical protein S101258_00451 [Lactiplantibacillus plantarum subsp. plantarum]